MPTNIQTFSLFSTSFNGASSGNSIAFGFDARVIEVQNLGAFTVWAKLGTTGPATTGDLSITSCVSGVLNTLLVDLGLGYTSSSISFTATSTAAQFALNAYR